MQGTQYKKVTVKEDPKTSLAEAGIYPMTLEDGMRAVALAHVYYPHHDRSMLDAVMRYIKDSSPDVIFLLGGIFDEEAFKYFGQTQENYLHDWDPVPEVLEAEEAGGFEDQILALGEKCGEFLEWIQKESAAKVVYVPSATHLSMGNEIRLIEWVQQTKRFRDAWAERHPDASDLPSDPTIDLPKKLEVLFNLHGNPMIRILRFGAAALVNNKHLFMIGDFRRRHPGSAGYVEWEQRGYSVVRSFDGKVASGWFTTPGDTMPAPKLDFHEFHEVGHLWHLTRMGQYRDYDRRAQGFYTCVVVNGDLFGQSVPIIDGADGRRSFVVDGVPYTETEPYCCSNGSVIEVGPRKLEDHDHPDPRRPLKPVVEIPEGEDEADGAKADGSEES